MKTNAGVLISGGYGEVGRRIAALLAPEYPGCIVVGGRDAADRPVLARARDRSGRGVAPGTDSRCDAFFECLARQGLHVVADGEDARSVDRTGTGRAIEPVGLGAP